MSPTPYQQAAFIAHLPSPVLAPAQRALAGVGLSAARLLAAAAAARGLTGDAGDLARLDHALESPQVLADLLLGDSLEEVCGDAAQRPDRRSIAELDDQPGTPPAREIDEADLARIVDRGTLDRAPGDALRGAIVHDHRVPLEHGAGRDLHRPVRAAVVVHLDRADVLHELRQVRQVAPVGVHLVAWLAHLQGLADAHRLRCRGVDAESAVRRAASAGAALEKKAAHGGADPAHGAAAVLEAVVGEEPTHGDGDHALGRGHVRT
jgi:hypothetical protein